MAALFQ